MAQQKPQGSKNGLNSITKILQSGAINLGYEYEFLVPALFALRLLQDENVKSFVLKLNPSSYKKFDDLVVSITTTRDETQHFAFQLKHREIGIEVEASVEFARSGKSFFIPTYLKALDKLPHEELTGHTFVLFTNTIFKNCQDVRDHDIQRSDCSNFKSVFFKTDHVYTVENRYVLMAEQESVRELIGSFAKFFCDETIATLYINFFRKLRQSFYDNSEVTRDEIILKIAKFLLQNHTVKTTIKETGNNERTKVVREVFQKFDLIIVTNRDVVKLWEECPEELTEELRQKALEHKIITKDESMTKDKILQIQNLLQERLWFLTVNQDSERNIQLVVSLCRTLKEFKLRLVLVGEEIPLNDVDQMKVFRKLYDLKNVDINAYETFTETFKISLQGREPKPIKYLQEECSIDLDQFITPDDLLEFLNSDITIGKKLPSLPEPYILRKLSKTPTNIKLLRKICEENKTIIQCNGFLTQFENFLRENERNIQIIHASNFSENMSGYRKPFVVLTEKETSRKCFGDFLHLKLNQDFSLEWTEGELDPNMKEIFNHPVNAVCGRNGAGKTTVMKHIAINFPLDHWVVAVFLKQIDRTIFQKPQNYKMFFRNFIGEESRLGQDVRNHLKTKKKFVFLLDGLDELSNDYVSGIIHVIKRLRDEGYKIWIFCVEYLKELLMEELEIYSIFNVKYLTKDEQVWYIRQWINITEGDVEKILHSILEQMSIDILKLPFYLYIVTRIIIENSNIDNILTVNKMYSRFIDGRIRHNLSKKGHEVKSFEIMLNLYKNFYIRECQIGALKSCLDSTTFNAMKLQNDPMFINEISEKRDLFELVTEITADGIFIFTHNNFALYFAAQWLSEHFEKVPLEHREFIISSKYSTLFKYFNTQMAENCPMHLAILNQDLCKVRTLAESHLEDVDRGGRTPLHLASVLKDVDGDGNDGEILQYLIEAGADPLKSDIFLELNSFQYADGCNSLRNLEKLAQIPSFDLVYLRNYQNLPSLVMDCVTRGYVNLLKQITASKGLSFLNEVEGVFNKSILHLALENDQDEVAEFLIENGPDLRKTDTFNRTALHKSAMRNNYYISYKILNKTPDTESGDFGGRTALDYAVKMKRPSLAHLLLENGANVNAVDNNLGRTPLHKASYTGNTEVAQLLIDRGAIVNFPDKCEKTPLHRAAEVGYFETVKCLLSNGANINAVDKYKKTPLHYAVSEGHEAVINILVEQEGCDVSIRDVDGKTVFDIAMEMGYEDIGRFQDVLKLEELKDAKSKLPKAVKEGNLNQIKLFLEQGVDIETRYGLYEQTILHFAALEGHEEMVTFLLNENANFSATNSLLRTPLHLAAKRGHLGIVKMLLQKDNNKNNISDVWGITPIQLAGYKGHKEVIQAFIDSGITPNCRSEEGGTVLHSATRGGHKDLVEYLISIGGDVKLKTNKEKTCLHIAVQRVHVEVVSCLLNTQEDILNLVDNRKRTALHWAVEKDSLSVVEKLVQAGARLDMVDIDNRTPLDVANYVGKKLMADYLKMKLKR